MSLKKYNIRAVLTGTLWALLGVATIIILVAAVQKKNVQKCTGTKINISGVRENYFIDKKDVEQIILRHKNRADETTSSYDLQKIETVLEREIWIRDAELFFDNNGILQANVEEREPVARVFSLSGESFYIDSTLTVLPLSEKFSARLPVFTGFPIAARIFSKADSMLLNNVKDIALVVNEDPFLMAMIEQVDITWQRSFELIPKLGGQVVIFGDGKNALEKFRRLKLFYKNVIVKTGWSKYSQINLQYAGQVVAKIRDADDVTSDSLRTVQLMQLIAENTARQVQDSLKNIIPETTDAADSAVIQRSVQRDEEPGIAGNEKLPVEDVLTTQVVLSTPKIEPVVKKPVNSASKATKQVVPLKQKATTKVNIPAKAPANKKVPPVNIDTKKPKAVMPGPIN